MIAIFLPIIIFIIFFAIAEHSLDSSCPSYLSTVRKPVDIEGLNRPIMTSDCDAYISQKSLIGEWKTVDAFDFDETWFIWLFYLILTLSAEFVLFDDKIMKTHFNLSVSNKSTSKSIKHTPWNKHAITSFVLGIFAMFGLVLLGWIGIWFGIQALVDIQEDKSGERGKYLAIAGLILCVLYSILVYFGEKLV